MAYLEAATAAVLAGELSALVTAPISKELGGAGRVQPSPVTPSTWQPGPALTTSP